MNDNIAVTALSISELEFWINDQRKNLDEVNSYINIEILPRIITAVYKIEYDLCKENINYFMNHYTTRRNKA
jgi:hypothetical protein